MKTKILGLLAVGMLAGPIIVQAGVIIQASSATASSTFAPYSPAAAINQFGLNSNYVSGVTDFDAFVPTATHADINIGSGAQGWFNNGGSTATFTMDFGASILLQRLALWTDVNNPNNINSFDVLLSDDIAFGSFVNAGSFAAANDPNDPTLSQVFDFTDAVARYLRLDIKSSHGGAFVGFAEVAAETEGKTSVPEPGSLALLGLGLAGLGLSRRRKV